MGFYDAIRIGASGAADTAYTIDRSLRFNPDDITYLEKTFSSTGNQRTFTVSFWIKRCNLGRNNDIFSPYRGGDGSNESRIQIENTDQFRIYDSGGSSGYPIIRTLAVLRDTSAWYHLVCAVDTTQATDSNRIKLYINGVQQEIDTAGGQAWPNQNQQLGWNKNHYHRIGAYGQSSSPASNTANSDYLAEFYSIDGQQLTPATFAETNADTGQWIPKNNVDVKAAVTFGTNGFYLNFSDNSGTTATTLGKDYSGNGHNFTPYNFSVAAGTGNDSVSDSPTNNFATLNPLSLTGSGGTFSNGNLDFTADSNYATRAGTFSIKNGKWYWEITVTNYGGDQLHGIVYGTNPNGDFYAGSDSNQNVFGIGWYGEASGGGVLYGAVPDGSSTGQTISAGTSALSSYTTNDVLGFASDIPNGTLAFYKNGSLLYTLTGIGSHDWFPVVNGYGTSSRSTINFGQRPFTHTQPTGFKTLCSANLPDPTILLPEKHFVPVLWTGNSASGGSGTTQTISGLNFAPDWLWIKSRSGSQVHSLNDTVRGVNKQLNSASNDSETSYSGRIGTFNSDGFILGADGDVNYNGYNYVGWNWNAGDTDGKTYTVTVVSDSGNKYRFDGFGTSAVTLDLAEGGTYIFNYPSAHPLKFSTTSDGTHGGGSEYTTGVTHNSSTQVTIVVAASAPQLYYYCSIHSGMGGAVNTNSTLGSSNFDGSKQAVVKANASAGFSIVSFTGTGSALTVGHGLGVAPDVLIVKNREEASSWRVFHHKNTSAPETEYLALDNTNATFDRNDWNDTLPTSTVFSVGPQGAVNNNNIDYIGYIFSEVAGYSKFGSYTGNGNADGTFVFTDFRPAWVLIKKSSSAGSWVLWDNKRSPNNVCENDLNPNRAYQEGYYSNHDVDFLANGFKLRSSDSTINHSGYTYVYLAFAKSPFKNARAR